MYPLRALLLNNNYETLQFIQERRAIALFLKEKVEVLSEWDEAFVYLGNFIRVPSVLRLNYQVRRPKQGLSFSRRSIFKRDNYRCQYCGQSINSNLITLDHVVPKAHGGRTSYLNCVTACQPCNSRKGGRTPEQANMKLLIKPYIPTTCSVYKYEPTNSAIWHDDWDFYIKTR